MKDDSWYLDGSFYNWGCTWQLCQLCKISTLYHENIGKHWIPTVLTHLKASALRSRCAQTTWAQGTQEPSMSKWSKIRWILITYPPISAFAWCARYGALLFNTGCVRQCACARFCAPLPTSPARLVGNRHCDGIWFLFCQLFGQMNHYSSLAMTVACFFVFNVWELTVKETVLGTGASRDNQAFPCLIMTINDACTFNLALIITISDASKNQRKRLDPDNQIKVYRLIGTLVKDSYFKCPPEWQRALLYM